MRRNSWRVLAYVVALAVAALVAALMGKLPTEAAASSIVVSPVNFNEEGDQVVRTDTAGHAVDAHDGDLKFFEGRYWLYGTSYACGYGLQVAGTRWCGFKVYSSTDLVVWQDEGYLFDGSTSRWQGYCAPMTYGCYRPHVEYNASTDKYVLWFNGYWPGNASGYLVMTSDAPAGLFTLVDEAQVAYMGANSGGFANGDHDLFVDADGTGYVVYTRLNTTPSHVLTVERLTPDYLNGNGQHVVTAASGREAPSLFKRGSTWYLVYSGTCPYCSAGKAYVRTAPSPMGPWGPEVQVSSDSCGGQTSFVAAVNEEYLLGVDLWRGGQPNQGLANYYWTKMNFDTAPVAALVCNNPEFTVLGQRMAYAVGAEDDQSSGEYGYRQHCDVRAGWSRLQSFVPARNGTLSAVRWGTYRQAATNGSLVLDIVRLDRNLRPVGPVLGSRSLASTQIGTALHMHSFAFNVQVHAGVRYGIVAWSTATAGCYGFGYSDYQPYALGSAAYRGANLWVTEGSRSLKFVTEVS